MKKCVLLILLSFLLISCGPSESEKIQAQKCESLFENLYEQQRTSSDLLFQPQGHLSSLVIEVSIAEDIKSNNCYELLKDVDFGTYGFKGLDGDSLYKSLICELGYNVAWYRDYSSGEVDDLTVPSKHCPLGEYFYQEVNRQN